MAHRFCTGLGKMKILLSIVLCGMSLGVQGLEPFEQEITLSSDITGATCEVNVLPSQVNFHGSPPQFNGKGAWKTSGQVEHFNVSLTNCVQIGASDTSMLAPTLTVDSANYHVGGNCGDQTTFDCLWRDNSSNTLIGFLLAKHYDTGDADTFYQRNTSSNNLVAGGQAMAIGASGSSVQQGTEIPFSMVATCGQCTQPVTQGNATAAIQFTFDYQ